MYSSVTLAFLKVPLQGHRSYYSLLKRIDSSFYKLARYKPLTGIVLILSPPFTKSVAVLTRHVTSASPGLNLFPKERNSRLLSCYKTLPLHGTRTYALRLWWLSSGEAS